MPCQFETSPRERGGRSAMVISDSIPVRSWTGFLEDARAANIFQSPALMEVYSRTRGFEPHVLAVEDAPGIRALLACVFVTYSSGPIAKFASRSLAVGGPLGDPVAFPDLLRALDALASRKTSMSQIRNLQPPEDKSTFETAGYHWEDHINYLIDLAQGPKALMGKMSKARRKGLRLAEESRTEVRDLSSAAVEAAYGLLRETCDRAKVPLAPQVLFENAISILAPRGQLWCLTASLSGSMCAVRFVLRWRDTLYDWYAGSSDDGRQHHADELLVWETLKRGMLEGCKTFDFGGAGPPGASYGPAEFKRRFGGAMINPGRFERVYRPLVVRALRTGYKVGRKLAG